MSKNGLEIYEMKKQHTALNMTKIPSLIYKMTKEKKITNLMKLEITKIFIKL